MVCNQISCGLTWANARVMGMDIKFCRSLAEASRRPAQRPCPRPSPEPFHQGQTPRERS
jgi:hypothetical protein